MSLAASGCGWRVLAVMLVLVLVLVLVSSWCCWRQRWFERGVGSVGRAAIIRSSY